MTLLRDLRVDLTVFFFFGGDVDNWLSKKGCAWWNSCGCDRTGDSSLGWSRRSSGVAVGVCEAAWADVTLHA